MKNLIPTIILLLFVFLNINLVEAQTFSPVNGATDVPVSGNILEIEFSINFDLSFGNRDYIEILRKFDDESIAGYRGSSNEVSIKNGNILQVDISDLILDYDTEYYIVVDDGFIIGYSGFNDNSTWVFTTEEEPLSLSVVSFTPTNSSTDIPVSGNVLEIEFSINFDLSFGNRDYIEILRRFDDESIAGYRGSSNEVSIKNGNILQVDISDLILDYDTEYYIVVDDGFIIGYSGFDDNSTWVFTTEEEALSLSLVSFTPTNSSTDIPVSGNVLEIEFNINFDLSFGNRDYIEILRKFDDESIAGYRGSSNEVSIKNGNILQVDISDLILDYDTEYYIVVDDGFIIGYSGFSDNSTWSFTTEEEPLSLSAVSFTPTNNSTDIPVLGNVLEVEFNINFDLSFGSRDYIEILRKFDDESIASFRGNNNNVSIKNGNILQVDISDVIFDYDTEYYIVIDDGFIIDYSGFNNDSTWSFTTEEEPDDILKSISFTPADGATEVPVKNNTLIIEFNGPISKGDGSKVLRIHRKSDGDLLVGIFANQSSVTIVDETKLEVDISSTVLKYITEYYITIDDGFVIGYSGISDNSSWSFTTQEAPPIFEVGYPKIIQKHDGFYFEALTNINGNVYYVVTNNPTPPSVENIVAGRNSSGGTPLARFSSNIENGVILKPNLKEYGNIVDGTHYYLHAVVENSSATKYSDTKFLVIDRVKPILEEDTRPVVDCDIYPIDGDIMLHFSEIVFDFDDIEEVISTLSKASFDIKKGEESIEFTLNVDAAKVYLIPDEIFEENQEYTIIISNISDANYNIVDEITRTFTTDMTNVWIGNNSSAWLDNENWFYNSGFVSGKSVIIQSGANSPVISSNVTVNNLTIEADALLEQTNGEITIRGDLELLSSSISNATYIPTGGSLQVVGDTRVYQYIDNSLGLNVNYLIGTPTLGANNSNVESGYVIKKYNNTTNTWDAIGYDTMQPGVGYVAYALNDLVFKGDINTNLVSVNVTRTDEQGYGWNILANPYTASIDWNELDNSELVENSYWLWHPSQKLYNTYNGELGVGTDGIDNIIPSNHAFIIKVRLEKEGGVFNFPMNARRPNKSNFLKSARSQYDHIKLSVSGNGATDQLAIAFAEDASVGIDKYDTEKYISSSSTVEIFSNVQSDKLSINTLPIKNEDQEVLLGYKSTKVGDYTLSIDKNSTGFDEITLLDLVESREVNILEESYSFSVTKNETVNNRFKLIFPASVSTPISVLDNDNFKVITDRNKVWIQVVPLDKAINYRIYTIQGQKIVNGTLTEGTNFVGSLTNGVYILQIESENNTIYREKLFLKE